jgi:hypothetical protein
MDTRERTKFMADHDEQHKTIHFTIDGKPFTTRDDDQEAAALLRLAGLDPNAYDLASFRCKTRAAGRVR